MCHRAHGYILRSPDGVAIAKPRSGLDTTTGRVQSAAPATALGPRGRAGGSHDVATTRLRDDEKTNCNIMDREDSDRSASKSCPRRVSEPTRQMAGSSLHLKNLDRAAGAIESSRRLSADRRLGQDCERQETLVTITGPPGRRRQDGAPPRGPRLRRTRGRFRADHQGEDLQVEYLRPQTAPLRGGNACPR